MRRCANCKLGPVVAVEVDSDAHGNCVQHFGVSFCNEQCKKSPDTHQALTAVCLEPPRRRQGKVQWCVDGPLVVLLTPLFLAVHLTVKLLQCSLDRTPPPNGEEVLILTATHRQLQLAFTAATLRCQTHCDLPFVCVLASVLSRQSGFIQSLLR